MANKSFNQWIRLIAAAAIIGLTVGLGLWIVQRNFHGAPAGNQAANNARAASSPLIQTSADNNESVDASERDKDRLGDKLAEAALDLREERRDLAVQALNEAAAIAQEYEASDRDLAKRNLTFVGDIKRAASEVEAGKIEIAGEIINDLLDRLNLLVN